MRWGDNGNCDNLILLFDLFTHSCVILTIVHITKIKTAIQESFRFCLRVLQSTNPSKEARAYNWYNTSFSVLWYHLVQVPDRELSQDSAWTCSSQTETDHWGNSFTKCRRKGAKKMFPCWGYGQFGLFQSVT